METHKQEYKTDIARLAEQMAQRDTDAAKRESIASRNARRPCSSHCGLGRADYRTVKAGNHTNDGEDHYFRPFSIRMYLASSPWVSAPQILPSDGPPYFSQRGSVMAL